MIEVAFEKFTKTHGRGYFPKASIWGKGQIGLNQGAVGKFSLDSFDYVVLFYDKESKKIGIKFTSEKEDGIIKIVKRPGSGISFSAKAFLDFYDIDYSKRIKYNITHDKENDLYVLNSVI